MSVSKWRYTEECNGRPCPGDCDHCSFEPADLINRADAIEAVWKCVVESELLADWNKAMESAQELLSALPSAEADMSEYADRLWKIAYERGKREASADANPTVVRCKNMIPYGDFREWAKRIREDNPNVIVIPFDAEVASADAVPQLKQTDTLIIADALRYLAQDTERHLADRTRADALRQQFLKYGASMCHSAEAVQGEWIEKGGELVCSVCGNSVSFSRTPKGWVLGKFCQSCGARMKGGAE